MSDSFQYDVFLSHNKADKPQVRRLAERLRAAGLRVWFDEWVIQPGDDIYLAVEGGLEASRTLMLCLSSAALGSDWVGLERSTVLFRDPANKTRRFVPLLLADCNPPDSMKRYKCIDFREDTVVGFENLVTACTSEATKQPTRGTVKRPDTFLAKLQMKHQRENEGPEPLVFQAMAPRNAIKDLVISIPKKLGAVAGIWLFFEIVNHFIPSKPLSEYRLFGLVVFLLVGVILGPSAELMSLHRSYKAALASQTKHDSLAARIQDVGLLLAEALRSAYTKRNWDGVIRLGSALSRPLWLTGRYPLRIEIGKLVEAAASFSKKPEFQAAALIDDLGWTNVALGSFPEAVAHIKHGLRIAQEAGVHDLVCKAYRHLSGIALKQGKIAEAEEYAYLVEERLTTIADDSERKAMAASLNYLRGRIAQSKGDNAKALELVESAKEAFVQLDDRDRSVKLIGAIGEIQLASDFLKTAKDTFREGITAAYGASRGDCLLMNQIGLAKIAQKEAQYSDARELLMQASQTALDLGDTRTAQQLEEKAKTLPA